MPGLRRKSLGLVAVFAGLSIGPAAAYSVFDGTWMVDQRCEAEGGAPAESWSYTAVIRNADLLARRNVSGDQWGTLRGHIKPDGTAWIEVTGMVNRSRDGRASMTGRIRFWLEAHFDESAGRGQVTLPRDCRFVFSEE